MSASLFADDVLFLQRLLRAEGLYLRALDGVWGRHTEAAACEFERRSLALRDETRTFDARSERHIATLALRAQREARLFLARVLDRGLLVRIISGTRSYAEQNALYRQGRFGNGGRIVTHARGGFSNHNFGIAWDVGVFSAGGGYVTDGPAYDRVAEAGLSPTIEWGGHWRHFVDKPHYQLKLGIAVAELRPAFEAGQAQAAFA